MSVAFLLPRDIERLRIEAIVCHSERDSGRLECGAAFDWDATENAKAANKRVLKYVGELLRRRDWDSCLEAVAVDGVVGDVEA